MLFPKTMDSRLRGNDDWDAGVMDERLAKGELRRGPVKGLRLANSSAKASLPCSRRGIRRAKRSAALGASRMSCFIAPGMATVVDRLDATA